MNKFVSIILPTYNSVKFIKETINSILNQTYKHFEIVIVDDCSTDNTYKFLNKIKKKYKSKIKLLKTEKNSGNVATPRNLGVKHSKGELICFLDSDDIWDENKLESQINLYKEKNTIYTTAASYFDSKNNKSGIVINFVRKIIQKFIIKKINKKGFQWLYIYNPIIVSSVLAHKSVFKKNFFDEDINAREDLDMWIRLRRKNFKFFFSENISVKIFRRKNSMSSNLRKELITIIRSLSNTYLKINSFSKLNYFLIGIIFKFFLTFIKINKNYLQLKFKQFLIVIFSMFLIVFYTPLFWYMGKSLLYHDEINEIRNIKNIVVFSGHGNASYYNMTYQHRYKDILQLKTELKEIENIYILGRLQDIPEQRIIEKLLISDGFDKKKLKIIYEEFNNTHKNIINISRFLNKKNIDDIIFVTSPYHTKRAKLLWNKNVDVNVKIYKSLHWPRKNNFFEYSKNKKIILYEHASILYNKILGNI